jgi:hypothetical protein
MSGVIQQEIALADVVSGLVRVEAELVAPAQERVLDELASVLRSVFAVADRGAYVARTAPPNEAAFQVMKEDVGDFAIAWDGQARATDWRLAQIVRNVLVMFTQVHHPIARFSMISGDSGAVRRILPPLGARPVDEAYPGVSALLAVPVEKSQPQTFRGGRRVAIEFVDRLGDAALKETIRLLELWGTASFGAYASDEREAWTGDAAIVDLTADIMDDWTVEAVIERFGAPEVAWNSLMNLTARVHTDIAPVAKLVIE